MTQRLRRNVKMRGVLRLGEAALDAATVVLPLVLVVVMEGGLDFHVVRLDGFAADHRRMRGGLHGGLMLGGLGGDFRMGLLSVLMEDFWMDLAIEGLLVGAFGCVVAWDDPSDDFFFPVGPVNAFDNDGWAAAIHRGVLDGILDVLGNMLASRFFGFFNIVVMVSLRRFGPWNEKRCLGLLQMFKPFQN
jgi:hypothetical protein